MGNPDRDLTKPCAWRGIRLLVNSVRQRPAAEESIVSSTPLENLLREDRVFPPPAAFAAAANAHPGIYEEAEEDYVAFWLRQALERLTWVRPPIKALDDSAPSVLSVVSGWGDQPLLQLPRSAPGVVGRQGRLSLGRRTRRRPDSHIP